MNLRSKRKMAKLWLVLLLTQLSGVVGAPSQAAVVATPMELTIVTTEANQSVSLPIYGTVNAVTVSWSTTPGDASGPVSTAGLVSHTYAQPGTYTVKISGTSFTQFGNGSPYAGAQLITGVATFGTMGIKIFNGAFMGATALTSLPAALPTGTTSLKNMLNGATAFNQDISTWVTSAVTNLSGTFAGATSFNQNISAWATSNVTDFSSMFANATAFNNGEASSFGLNPMTTSSAKWNTAKATNLSSMFAGATSFNQSVANWDVSKVTNFASIFSGASRFKQSVAVWKPHAATNLSGFLHGGAWNTRTYDSILSAWSADSANPASLTFDAGASTYSAAASAALANLTGTGGAKFGWQIIDGGQTTTKASRTLSWQSRPADTVGITDSLPQLIALDSEGGKTFSYSLAASSSSVCNLNAATGALAIINVGDCTYTATIAEDAYALAATVTTTTVIKPIAPSEPRSVQVSVRGRDITVSWVVPASTGGIGLASYTATASAGGSDYVCTTPANATTCTIRGVSRGENGYTYLVTTESVGNPFRTDASLVSRGSVPVAAMVDAPLTRAVNWVTQPPIEVDFGPLGTVAAVDSLGVSAATYSIDPTSTRVCSVDAASGALTALRSGMCNYIATVAADPDRHAASATGLVKIRPFTPGPPIIDSTSVDGRNITVNFSPPSYDGGYDLGHYVFTASTLVNSFSCEVSAPATSCTIYDTSRGELGFDYSVSGVTYGADFDGKPGLVSQESDALIAHVDAPLVTALSWMTTPGGVEPFGDLRTLNAAEANGLGEITYSVSDSSASVCSVEVSTGRLQALRAGDCSYRADIARTADLFDSSVAGLTHIAAVAPSPPKQVLAAVDARKVAISWTAPASDGGVQLVDYEASITGGGRTYSCHAVAPQQNCSINNVDRGQSGVDYSVTVTATNAAFDAASGLTSLPSDAVIAQVDPPVRRNLVWVSEPGAASSFGDLPALRVGGDLNGDAPVYSVRFDSEAVCRVDANTGELIALRAGTCHFSATVPADPDYYLATIDDSTLISPVAPSPPQNITTEVSGRNIRIAWFAPAADGGNGIASYRVSLHSDSDTYVCEVAAPSNECVIAGVTRGQNGMTYRASVIAIGESFLLAPSLESPPSDQVDAVVAAPITSIVTWQSAPADQVLYGALPSLAVSGNSQIADPVFAIDSASATVCRVNPSSGALAALSVGLCNYRVDIAADPDHSAASLTGSAMILASPPTPPLTLETSVSGRDVTLSWASPQDDGGNGIASYQAELSSADHSYACDVSASVRQCTISGVSRGQQGYNYVARVRAVGAAFNGNPQQTSQWSQNQSALVDAPMQRNLTWASAPADIEPFGPLAAAIVTGDVQGNRPIYSVASSSADCCRIDSSTGALTALHAGICNYRVDIAADEDYFAAAQVGTVVIRPIAPSVPRNLQAVVDGRNLTVSWAEPLADGGNGISGYNVKVEGGGQVLGCDTVVGQNTCQLAALDRGLTGINYLVTVRAIGIAFDVNPALVSDWAAPVDSPVAGPAIRALTWVSKPDTAVTFGPLQPLVLGGDLFGLTPVYQVDAASAGVCTVEVGSGALVAQHVGLCVFSASVLGDSDHQPGLLASSTLIKPAPPAPPQNVKSSFDGQSLTVTWQPPTDFGGSDLAAYLVTASSPSGNLNCRVSATENYCVINAVMLGAHYEISVQALNAGVMQVQGVASQPSDTAAIDIPAPPYVPVETPTPTPTPTPEVTPTPTPTPEPKPAPKPTIAAPAAVAQATLSAVTLAASAAAAAAGAAGAAGGAAGAAGGAAGGSTGGASGAGGAPKGEAKGAGEGDHKTSESLGESAHLRHLAKGNVDAALKLAAAEHWGDKLAVWALPAATAFDAPPKKVAQSFARVLPLASKVFIDGTYLRAMFGSLWILLTVASATVGAIGISQTHGDLALPSAAVISAIIAIGIFDVFAGFVGAAVLAAGVAIVAGASTASDARLLFGVVALGVTPRVISGAFRALRRPRLTTNLYLWERFVDLIAAPMLAAWASLQIVDLLPSLSGSEHLDISGVASMVPSVVAICMVIRVGLEELAGRYFPIRVEITQTDQLDSPPISQLLISALLRAATFAFVAGALIGDCWQLYVGALLFVLPNLLTLVQHRLPNSPTLYHIMPQGLANLCLSLWIGGQSLALLTGIFGETPDLARIGFILLPLPSLALSILKLFGRKGKDGEKRFYAHPKMVWFYRAGGLLVLYLTAELIHTINTTTLF